VKPRIALWWWLIGAALAAVGGVVVLFGPRWGRGWIERSVRENTGLEIRIGNVRAGLRPLHLQIEDLRLLNPPEFEPGEAMVIRELWVEIPWSAVWRREPMLNLVRIHLPRLVVLRRPDGVWNWQRIGEATSSPRDTSAPAGQSGKSQGERPSPSVQPDERAPSLPTDGPAQTAPQPSLRIARLNLKVDTVEVREQRSDQRETRIRRMDLNVDQSWTNVTDLGLVGAELAGVVMLRAAPLLVTEVVRETSAGGAATALDKLEQKATRLLQQFGGDGAVTNLLDQGIEELRKALPGLF